MTRLGALLLTVLAVLAARDASAQGTGEWVRADGSRVYLPCPRVAEYGARTRLPQSCRAALPGILYTLERDAQSERDATAARAHAEDASALRTLLQSEQAKLERVRRELSGLSAEHETIAAQLAAAERVAEQADADRRAAESRARGFDFGDAAIGASVGAVVAGALVLVLIGAL